MRYAPYHIDSAWLCSLLVFWASPDMCRSPGCRLYSSAHFNDSFPQHSDPEVLKTPLEGVALIMKAMGIDKVWLLLCAAPPSMSCQTTS